MSDRIDQMRRDFNRLLAFRLHRGEWTKADADEHGLAIKAAIDSGDETLINQWAGWCAGQAASEYGPMPRLPNAALDSTNSDRGTN